MDSSKRPQSLRKRGSGRVREHANLKSLPNLYGNRKWPDSLRIPATGRRWRRPEGATRRDESLERLREEKFALATQFGMSILLLEKKSAELGKGAASSSGARFDGVVNTLEIVPSDGLHVGTQDEVGVTLPGFELVLLRGTDGAADHLKNVSGSAAMAVVQTNGDAYDGFGAEFACGASGYRSDETPVGEAAGTNHDRLEKPRESATGANGVLEAALLEDDGITGAKVGGDDGGGDGEILKLIGIEEAVHEGAEAFVAGQAKAGNTPACEITEANLAAFGNDARERGAAGIGGGEDAAHAAAGNAGDGNVVLFQNAKHPQMRIAARKTTAERQPDAGTQPGCGGE